MVMVTSTRRPAPPPTPGSGRVRVIHGCNDDRFDGVAGATVGAVRESLADAFNLTPGVLAWVNGRPAPPGHRLRAGDTLEFVHPGRTKGALEPDELAMVKRIEEKLDRLLNSPSPAAGPVPPSRKLGRRVETDEIGGYIATLRDRPDPVPWKSVKAACKAKWPDDPRVRNVEQLRKTLRRYRDRRRPAD